MTLTQVIAGLKRGKSFRREVAGIVDTVRPVRDGVVLHTVVNERSGSGGESEIDISRITRDRWPSLNWEQL